MPIIIILWVMSSGVDCCKPSVHDCWRNRAMTRPTILSFFLFLFNSIVGGQCCCWQRRVQQFPMGGERAINVQHKVSHQHRGMTKGRTMNKKNHQRVVSSVRPQFVISDINRDPPIELASKKYWIEWAHPLPGEKEYPSLVHRPSPHHHRYSGQLGKPGGLSTCSEAIIMRFPFQLRFIVLPLLPFLLLPLLSGQQQEGH